MKIIRLLVFSLIASLLLVSALRADEVSDKRLRDQLRQTMLEMRKVQDENSELQMKLAGVAAQAKPVESARASRAEIDKVRGGMKQEISKMQAEMDAINERLSAAQQSLADALKQLDEKNTLLKSAQGRVGVVGVRIARCEKDNVDLVRISGELLQRYHDMGVWEAIWTKEPLTGLMRVRRENLVEKYRGQIIDATEDVVTTVAPDDAVSGTAGAVPAGQNRDAGSSNGRALVVFVGGRPHVCRNGAGRLICEPADAQKKLPGNDVDAMRTPQASR